MSFQERRIKNELERQNRFLDIARKFNNLFIQLKCFTPDAVSFTCSLLSTPSVAHIFNLFLEFPHVFSIDQILYKSRYTGRTTKKALKRLRWFQVIREQEKMWGLSLNPFEYPHSSIESDSPRKKNPCKDCRHAEFDGDNNPYCSLADGVWAITSDVESCESYDPIPMEFRYDKKTPLKSDSLRTKTK